MTVVLSLLLRLLAVAAGLLLAASVAVVAAAGALLWGLHAAWCRLTGRPAPLGWQVAGGLAELLRRRAARPAPAPAKAYVPRGAPRPVRAGDVTDVEPR